MSLVYRDCPPTVKHNMPRFRFKRAWNPTGWTPRRRPGRPRRPASCRRSCQWSSRSRCRYRSRNNSRPIPPPGCRVGARRCRLHHRHGTADVDHVEPLIPEKPLCRLRHHAFLPGGAVVGRQDEPRGRFPVPVFQEDEVAGTRAVDIGDVAARCGQLARQVIERGIAHASSGEKDLRVPQQGEAVPERPDDVDRARFAERKEGGAPAYGPDQDPDGPFPAGKDREGPPQQGVAPGRNAHLDELAGPGRLRVPGDVQEVVVARPRGPVFP